MKEYLRNLDYVLSDEIALFTANDLEELSIFERTADYGAVFAY
jgi:hypothetical protein